MELRNDLVARAAQIASADGRPEPAVLDLVRAAIERGDSKHLMLVTMLDNLGWKQQEESLSPATEEQFDEIFQRAAALAVALDQTLAAGHVAAVAARTDAAGPPGLLTMLRQVLIHAVAGPDEQEQFEMRAALDRMNEERSDRTEWHVTKVWDGTVVTEREDEAAAVCPRCHRPLTSPLQTEPLDSDVGPVTAAVCGTCGAVLGLLPRT